MTDLAEHCRPLPLCPGPKNRLLSDVAAHCRPLPLCRGPKYRLLSDLAGYCRPLPPALAKNGLVATLRRRGLIYIRTLSATLLQPSLSHENVHFPCPLQRFAFIHLGTSDHLRDELLDIHFCNDGILLF